MRTGFAFIASLLASSVAAGVIEIDDRELDIAIEEPIGDDCELWKRRGGGRGGSRGGGGGRGGGGSRSSGSSSRTTNTYGNSNKGGFSPTGSGIQPRFGGGQFYGGGGRVPYSAGASRGGIVPTRSPMTFWPLYFAPYPVFLYAYGYNHHYRNETSDQDEERPVVCVCTENAACSCEDNEDDEFYRDIIGDGDYAKLNNSIVQVAEDQNGTVTIYLNGTLPNGTTVQSDNPDDYAEFVDGAMSLMRGTGYAPMVAAVAAAVFLI